MSPARLRIAALVAGLAAGLVTAPAAGEEISFTRDVNPALTKAGCNMGACHGSLQGRGGMALSLLGYNPRADYDALFKQARGRRASPAAPEHSLLLLKGTATIPHGGGVRMTPDSPTYKLLRDYIAQGMPPPGTSEPVAVRLEVTPLEVTLQPQQEVQLCVLAHWSDGIVRDVTAWALYDSRFKQRAEVDEGGLIRRWSPASRR